MCRSTYKCTNILYRNLLLLAYCVLVFLNFFPGAGGPILTREPNFFPEEKHNFSSLFSFENAWRPMPHHPLIILSAGRCLY